MKKKIQCRSVTRAPEPTPNKPSADGIGRVPLASTNIQMNANVSIDQRFLWPHIRTIKELCV